MEMIQSTSLKTSIKSGLSLIAFCCYAYLVLDGNTDTFFHYVTLAYALTALLVLLPVIWQKDQLQWRIRFPLFCTLFCISWAIAFAMTLLPTNILCPWGQWTMLLIAYLLVILLCFGYKYKD